MDSVFRVQRVPATEKSGRIHTSTASIAICPVPKTINLNLDIKEIRKETYKASGHGGQHLQKTETAVRLTHLPTKICVECQQERSQNANLELAMKRLAAKLYERQYAREVDKREKSRKLQMGSRERSEKIRTYNFLEQRVSDHRIKRNFHPLNEIMKGAEAFNEIIDALAEYNMKERLFELINGDVELK
uniref:Prokaryotic-type class I peptide chain release factors domain-containing protein n=1 Tax=Romanomermis culicivorax TaxID=13658 RepID=A0A915JZ73_ROMCU